MTSSFAGTSLPFQKRAAYCRRQRSLSARVRAGLPVISSVPVVGPLVNTILSPLVLLAVYAFGAFKFITGYSKTTYADSLSSKLGLTVLWPDSGFEDDYAFFDSLLDDNYEVAVSEEFWDSLLEDDYNLKPKFSPMIPKIALTLFKEYLEKISSSPNISQLLEDLKPGVLHRMKNFQDQSLEARKPSPMVKVMDDVFEANKFVEDLDLAYQQVQQAIQKAQEKQKKAADKHRRVRITQCRDAYSKRR
ncbi:hypothetical protein L7F22_057115 [Adiantum nelumboides]|nr:hypothetical protein [Adiantum nelumboides]